MFCKLIDMPRKNVVKRYLPNTYYHLYNRGVNKQPIFFSDKDYWVFRRYARNFLLESTDLKEDVFCLMENHFHLLLCQLTETAITHFMRRLMAKYCRYISKKYHHCGHLFESSFKGVLIKDERQLVKIRQYILNNPIEAGLLGWKHVGYKI